MTVWAVVSRDDTDSGSDHLVAGSYTSRGRAVDECVRYIFERIELRGDFMYSMAHDENHPEAAKFFSEKPAYGRTVVRRGCVMKLRDYVRDKLVQDGAYYVYDGTDSWHFDVDEHNVEGMLWTTVTWGDSDCEDPEFTTPLPESFTSEEAAVEAFIDYVKDLYESHHMKRTDEFLRGTRRTLKKDGRVRVALNDGTGVNCVLHRDSMENVKG